MATAIVRAASPRTAPSWAVRAHRWVYLRSRGWIGHGLVGVPTLVLWATGRRGGRSRPTVLVYGVDGDDLVVVPSNDGTGRPPDWLRNLEADPEVAVGIGHHTLRATAQIISEADTDHRRLWALMDDVNHGRYGHLQAKTPRPIPVVRLHRPSSEPLARPR